MIALSAVGHRVQQHIGRLDVPVDEPVQMSGVQRQRDLGDDVGAPARGQRPGGIDERAHVPALHVAHGDEQDAVALAGREDRDDVRVVDGGRGP